MEYSYTADFIAGSAKLQEKNSQFHREIRIVSKENLLAHAPFYSAGQFSVAS